MKFNRTIIFFITIFLIGCSTKEMRFTSLYVNKLKNLDPNITIVSVESLKVVYSDKGQNKHTAFLNNAYGAYLNGENEEEVIARYTRSAIETLNDDPILLEKIVPVVKDSNYLKDISASINQEIQIYYVEYSKELNILYAIDSNKNIRFITIDEFNNLKLSESDLRKIAIENLRKLLPKHIINGKNGLYKLIADGNYEASLLLFDDLWDIMKKRVDGELIISIPSRDTLYVTGSNNKKGIDYIKEKATEIINAGGYYLTDQLFIRENNSWIPFFE